ncbi:hypothetical protein N2152v2_003037 [Parachlorella kessleri]
MAPSQAALNVVGALGGIVLAACMTPQLVRLYKTRSARDISYIFLVLNAVGLSFTFVYLFYNGATVTWIAILVEIVVTLLVMSAKAYLDHWGPQALVHSKSTETSRHLMPSPEHEDASLHAKASSKEIGFDLEEQAGGVKKAACSLQGGSDCS